MRNVLEKLNQLIEQGIEYSEAHSQVSQQYNLTDRQSEFLHELYDEQD